MRFGLAFFVRSQFDKKTCALYDVSATKRYCIILEMFGKISNTYV